MHAHMQTTHAHTHTFTHKQTLIHTHTNVHMHTHIPCICTCTHMNRHKHIRTQTLTHKHIHMCTHTHTYRVLHIWWLDLEFIIFFMVRKQTHSLNFEFVHFLSLLLCHVTLSHKAEQMPCDIVSRGWPEATTNHGSQPGTWSRVKASIS